MGKNKTTKQQEPAKVSYFFGESYLDLWHTIQGAWKRNGNSIHQASSDLRNAWSDRSFYAAICLMFFKLAILVSIAVFGTLFTAIFSAIHIVVLFAFTLIIYFGFVLLRTIDSLFCLVKGLGNNCYNPGCQRKFTMPVYVCPKCKALHYKLVPSKYGIFKRTCNCGEKIPTTFINGRQKLDALCPHCHCQAIKGVHTSMLIPVVGGSNAGKTCFISMAINQIEKKAANWGLNYQYQYVQGDAYNDNIQRMNSGICPQKTNDLAFKYYNFFLTPNGDRINNLISVCDIAGEVFANQETMAKQQGYRFADGLIVIVDPLSITEYKNELKKTLPIQAFQSLNASTQPMNDVLSGLINTMESLYHVKAKDSIKTTVVIVFTKSDIPGLDEKIGEKAVSNIMSNDPQMDVCTASNEVCEKFLADYGETSFLNTVKGKFKNIQFFSCSALGHSSTGAQFSPVDVERPLLWMIDKLSKSIELSSIWGKKL